MRILELTAHIQTLSRTQTLESPQGKSATAAAAYRVCTTIRCERTGQVFDYSRKTGLVTTGMAAPKDAPAWAKDRASLWNAVEMRERNKARGPNAGAFKANAIVAREFLYGFPAELSAEGRVRVAEIVARHMVDRYGVAVDYAIHEPGKEGDQRNFHCHMMATSRRVEADGLTTKTRELDVYSSGPRHVKAWRAFLARTLNEALAAEGQANRVFVEHRSFKDRGSSQKPTRHQGKHKTHGQRKARRIEREAWRSKEQAGMAQRHEQEQTAQLARHEAAEKAQARDAAQHQAMTEKAITDTVAAQETAEKVKGLATRMVDRLTGRADQARQVVEQRMAANKARLAEIAAEIEADRRTLIEAHRQETKAQAERHRAETQQLDKAVEARVLADRAAEVQARRNEVQELERERHRDHGRERGNP